ncbi:MAG: peptide ABC transporter ATP-binding protein [bacterium (Candidatus Ratteibacteria) CG_4_10_14_3_um_filter_41_18]|uniref:Peptide ABC transporter ATP-binding protein n=2 Tax=Candidatus Ratteibacteria TaxID=2979319 RepID=A0A2M7E6X1_9BACT|nr:MAG: peptide ABC transporter ATP-binding protein [bacterium (Candidatus Ratteibacteria) CG01_land_8_20_14_3_00_40_19]PIX77188.1 MAG: peptide ABC transporter ATP-binding protein [bacterium (Candidatus Ratteibacteria) CG_4_10_14_3_um_filter_41_18]
MSLLEVRDLRVSFAGENGKIPILRGVNLKVNKGEVLGLAGESGCGKSLTALSILKLLPEKAYFDGGEILFEDENLLEMDANQLMKIRGRKIAMIFQEPGASLDPLFTIGNQIGEAIEKKLNDPCSVWLPRSSKLKVMSEVERLLGLVKMPKPKKVLHQYPHQLSGGMAQRAMIAMALAGNPSLLIADEPTTSLDVTTGSKIIALLKELRESFKMSILFISHNLALLSQISKRIGIMYLGRIVEEGPTDEILNQPCHPYTRLLLLCLPDPERRDRPLSSIPGSVPEPAALGAGCAFASRCPKKIEICRIKEPEMKKVGENHLAACHNL